MRLLAIAVCFILSACGTVSPYDVGPYAAAEQSDIPLCSKVTISERPGAAHWTECRVR